MSRYQTFRNTALTIYTLLFLPINLLIFTAPLLVYILQLINETAVVIFCYIAITEWSLIFLSSLFLQRMHCSTSCPISGIFLFVRHITKNREIMAFEYPKILGPITLSLWFSSTFYVALRAFGNYFDFLPSLQVYSRIPVIIFFTFYSISGFFALTIGKSKDRHYICPFSPFLNAGIRINEYLHLPAYRMIVVAENCKVCKQCNEVCIMLYEVSNIVKEDSFEATECLSCHKCTEVCKHQAIEFKWSKDKKIRKKEEITFS